MAIVNCKECKKEISSEAKTCPHCGFKVKGSFGCLSVIGAGFIFLLLIGLLAEKPKDNFANTRAPNLADQRSAAANACMLFIERVLHDPSSAKFDSTSEAFIDQNGPTSWTVQRSVRANNKFGALVLSTFECKLENPGNDWKIISINEIN